MLSRALKIILILIFTSRLIFAQWESVYIPTGQPLPYWLNAVEFSNFYQGYAVGHDTSSKGCILLTTNIGANWHTVYTTTDTLSFSDVTFSDSTTVFSVGYKKYCCNFDTGIIVKSVDFGNTWTAIMTTVGLHSICFPSSKIGYIAGYKGSIFKTTNGGNTWNPLNSNTTTPLISIYFINDTLGFACGGNNILKTSDGGINWTQQNLGNGYGFNKIVFPSDSVGYCLKNNLVYKTIDQGSTWNLQSTISNSPFYYSIFFTDKNIGYVTGHFDISNTTDGGITWTSQSATQGFWDDIMDVNFLNKNVGFSVGSRQFYRIPIGGIPVSINEGTRLDREDIISVFPNPSNGQLTFTNPKVGTGKFEICIFNILGKEVFTRTLFNNERETTIEISQFINGVYLVRVTKNQQILYNTKIIVVNE